MTLLTDFKKAVKERTVAVLSTAAVGAVVAACVAGYEVGKNVALKSYVHEYVDGMFARRDQIATLRDDIASLRDTRSKSENEDVIADLDARITTLQGRLESLLNDGQINQVDD